ncbi:YchJ family protein [Shewanella japonica]|uniref:YchJ family protein n=1 Tax=Shewanella japonica TaxID=93973 RepID=UPI0024949AE0|nr:YchJ family protein [Shewanella japonica]
MNTRLINTQTAKTQMANTRCPCGLNQHYSECCEPYHLNVNTAADVETLMRSRYCAFVLQEFQYLLDTHHPDFLNGLSIALLAENASSTTWLGLTVDEANQTANHGTVTFKAWFLHDGVIDAIFEASQFERVGRQWFYTTGEQKQAKLPKRNETCICHSGKKFKTCCLKKIS